MNNKVHINRVTNNCNNGLVSGNVLIPYDHRVFSEVVKSIYTCIRVSKKVIGQSVKDV